MSKDPNTSRKLRVAQNSPNYNVSKKKNCHVQTEEQDYFSFINEKDFIRGNGKIPKNFQNNYCRAINYVNKWNGLMNEYLKRLKNRRGDCGKEECIENLKITSATNFMSFFKAVVQRIDDQPLNERKHTQQSQTNRTPTRKNLDKSTQNKNLCKSSPNKESTPSRSANYEQFDEDLSDPENIAKITRHIQESQYKRYPPKPQSSPTPSKSRIVQNEEEKLPYMSQIYSPRFPSRQNDDKVRKTLSNTLWDETSKYEHSVFPSPSVKITPAKMCMTQETPIRKHSSIVEVPKKPWSVVQQKRRIPELLSPNGMMASKINANGTPLLVKNMFDEIQNPLGLFVSKGNILRNISNEDLTSGSSVILSDKESEDLLKMSDEENEKENLVGTCSSYSKENCNEYFEVKSTPHPLKLNERDLNSKDKNFIDSIGIFTESGGLKPDAKIYLENKEGAKKSPFRTARMLAQSQNVTKNYKVNYCTSESLMSEPNSSDVKYND